MDNDVQGTEYCIGFSTAITRAKDAINRQRTTLGSHERIGVFRVFGRDAGFTALYTAFVTSARCLIPEARFDLDKLAGILAEDHANNPSHYAFVIAAEGAMWQGGSIQEVGEADAFGHRHKANIAEVLACRDPSDARASTRSIPTSPTTCARASLIRSTRWSPSRSPTRPWSWSPTASAAA